MRFETKRNSIVLVLLVVLVFSFIALSLGRVYAEEAPLLYDPYWRPTLDGAFKDEAAKYQLGQNDVVSITVRNQDELSGNYVIGPDGNIQYSFVGDIKAEGLTKDQLKERLIVALERYVKTPEVTVAIAAYRSKFVYIIGEVERPGRFPLVGDEVSLREAVVAAGLPTEDAALRRVHVVTPHETDPVLRKVDLYAILYQGKLEKNIMLNPNDVVVVSATIPSEIAKALRKLLSPFNRAADVQDFYDRYK